MFAILLMGSAREVFHEPVKVLLNVWIEEMAKVLIESGLDSQQAREKAEDGVISIQGALILAQGLDDVAPFKRVLQQLPEKLLK